MAGRHLQNVTDNTVISVSGQKINIRSILWHNDDTAAGGMFMQLFNVASGSVTLGTTAPDMVLRLGPDQTQDFPLYDMEFATAFSYAITTDATGNTGSTGDGHWVALTYF